MKKKVVFYCHYGAGDIFESREFVKHYMKILGPDIDYYYAHGRPEYILYDMKERVWDLGTSWAGKGGLSYTEVTPVMNHREAYKESGDTLYINMWIGRDGKYVLPNIGVVVEKLYEMHNEMLRGMGLPKLEKELYSYIPRINYHAYKIDKINKYVDDTIYREDKTILISNGPVQSNQAKNFDFTPIIDKLCTTFWEYMFIETEKSGLEHPNLDYTGDIIGEVPGTDLNEISYLSTNCNVIIGRNSGPFVFAQVLDNWVDKNKTSLSFTYARNASHFVLSDLLPMKKEWSGETSVDGVYRKICEVIG